MGLPDLVGWSREETDGVTPDLDPEAPLLGDVTRVVFVIIVGTKYLENNIEDAHPKEQEDEQPRDLDDASLDQLCALPRIPIVPHEEDNLEKNDEELSEVDEWDELCPKGNVLIVFIPRTYLPSLLRN